MQSLVLLAQVFGVTVDDLIGREGFRAAQSSAEERHALVRLLATAGSLLGAAVLLIFAAHLISLLAPQDDVARALRIVLDVAALACVVALALCALPRLRSFMREHNLENAAKAASYLEGRGADEPLPSDPLFRWFIPYWKLWLVALVAIAFIATTILVGTPE